MQENEYAVGGKYLNFIAIVLQKNCLNEEVKNDLY